MNAEIGTSIDRAMHHLRAGGLVAIPTETVYGLAANGLDPVAVAGIFAAKDRPRFDPLILHTDHLDKITDLVREVPASLRLLAEHFMPGPLTILLPKTALVPDITTSGLPAVAIRIPDHPMALRLLEALDFPLAAPSANPFGYVSPTLARHVADQLGSRVDYILDGGPCSVGIESTIVRWTGTRVEVLRKGGVAIEAIEAIVGPVDVAPVSTSHPAAPGMLQSHYATTTPIVRQSLRQVLASTPAARVGYLGWDRSTDLLPLDQQRILSADGQFAEAASRLFAYMRDLDAMDLDIIVAALVPDQDLGRAINDKLDRAAAG